MQLSSIGRLTIATLFGLAYFCGGIACLPAQEPQFEQTPAVESAEVFGVDQSADASPKESPSKSTASLAAALKKGPAPNWIWGENNDATWFLKTSFDGAEAAELIAACDNVMTIWINGRQVARGTDWGSPVQANVTKYLREGENELLARVENQGGPAGFVCKLALQDKGKGGKVSIRYVVSNRDWQAAEQKDSTNWQSVRIVGKLGTQPWGNVFNQPPAAASSVARNVFQVLPGFQVERLFDVPKDKLGSWVCITFDNKGRLLASDQGGKGICRVTLPPPGSDKPVKVEKLDLKMTSAQGMLYAFDSLYFSVNGGPGSGFYRARDTNGDDQFDEVKLLKRFRGGGEHGPHAIRLSPDGKSLFVIAGNHTDPPSDFDSSLVPKNWSEDLLLPRQWDARGHARGKLAPGGWIAKTDPAGETWEIVSIGYRNPYDMDFNADGELFAYDADMEWDMGTPWYRPTRVVHATGGSEFGWRSGTGKWPTYFVDSLPPVVDIGPGSPVGVTFGAGAKFPAKYQKALYLLDWTFGTIYAIHLKADGASYQGVKEEFLARTPLPLTDVAIGPDGAMYFTIGGRGTQSALFRVTYQGTESTKPVDARDTEFAELRALRRRMEALQRPGDADVVNEIWKYLGHEDRHIRFAARTALEHQPVESWAPRAVAEKNPSTLIAASVALARQADPKWQEPAIEALLRLKFSSLSPSLQLDLLRAYALLFIRQGRPDPEIGGKVVAQLDPAFPADDPRLNRELSRVLVYLNAPKVIDKTLKLMAQDEPASSQEMAELLARNSGYGGSISRMLSNPPERQKIHYALMLRNMEYGWTLGQRKAYFEWFNEALTRSGGASYEGFIKNIRKEALDKTSPAERKALESTTIAPPKLTELPKPIGPGRKWTVADLLEMGDERLLGRDFENGKRAFAAARCVACHRFQGEGGATGPDLSNVAGRFSLRDLSEAIVEPSKVISDQYRATDLVTAQGKVLSGRIVGEEDGVLTIQTDAYDANKIVKVRKDDVERMRASPTSLMPAGLLDQLNADEVLDMVAYLLSRGNPRDAIFSE